MALHEEGGLVAQNLIDVEVDVEEADRKKDEIGQKSVVLVNPPYNIVPEVGKSKLAIAKSAHEIASIIAVRYRCMVWM